MRWTEGLDARGREVGVRAGKLTPELDGCHRPAPLPGRLPGVSRQTSYHDRRRHNVARSRGGTEDDPSRAGDRAAPRRRGVHRGRGSRLEPQGARMVLPGARRDRPRRDRRAPARDPRRPSRRHRARAREGLALCDRVDASLEDVVEPKALVTPMIRSHVRVACVPYAALGALAGDHASSVPELRAVLASPKAIEIASAVAYKWSRFQEALGRLPNTSLERMSFVHELDVVFYFIDPGYELRAQASRAHFVDAGRPSTSPSATRPGRAASTTRSGSSSPTTSARSSSRPTRASPRRSFETRSRCTSSRTRSRRGTSS